MTVRAFLVVTLLALPGCSRCGVSGWGVKNEPADPRVRLAIARWPDDAPRGAVTTFCLEHGITRKTFYAIRARARQEGPAAALQPRSRRPRSSPSRIGADLRQQAVDVRAALERSGLDHGPISVYERMRAMGIEPPSVASLARIFREAGVARAEPEKKPRAAYRRFVYPAPNACWQLDATGYVLSGGRTCVIFQLQDDHSRLAVASHVAPGETSDAALAVVRKGIAARGVPQRLLTDNGMALNPSRRGWRGRLVAHLDSLGVEAITGRPGKPTTQGKNERFHQTLFRYLDRQPLAGTIEQLQAQVDGFDRIYNTQRPHQGLPGRITPQQAWDATPAAEPPRPKQPPAPAAATAEYARKVRRSGGVTIREVDYHLGRRLAGRHVRAVLDHDSITFIDPATGEILAQHPIPEPGVRYIGSGRPRSRRPEPSPMS